MTQAPVSKNIVTKAEKLWQTIRQFDGIEKFLSAVTNSRIEGAGDHRVVFL